MRRLSIRRRGVFVAVIGPDGVGKTSLAAVMIRRWQGPTRYVHFRPRLDRPLPDQPPQTSPPPPPKARRQGSRPLGWLRLGLAVVRFWIGYSVRVRPALTEGALVVADRWSFVYVVQPFAAKYYGPTALARWAVRLMPKPDLILNLHAPPEVIRARKPELTVEEIERELALCADLDWIHRHDLDTTGNIEAVATMAMASLAPDRPLADSGQ